MLNIKDKKTLINYRIQRSYETLHEAKEVAKLNFWNLVGNRLYFAAFHMATALLLDRGLTSKSHAGVIHLIGKHFIVAGMMDKEYGRLFSRLYELRQSGDYDDDYNATEEEVVPYIEKATNFIKAMEALISLKAE